MAKIARKKPTPKVDVGLNQWCIEMAMKWPVLTTYSGNNGVYSAGGGLGQQQSDADVIGRANKIKAWLQSSPEETK